MNSLSAQALTFIIFFWGGIIEAVLGEIIFVLRRLFKNALAAVIITDIIFALMAAVIIIICSRLAGYGEIRFYSLLSFVLGYITVFFTVRARLSKFLDMIYTFVSKLKQKRQQKKEQSMQE